MNQKFKVAMVSYLNSKPFEFGLKHHNYPSYFDIITTDPASCARLFEERDVEISLIPAGAFHDLSVEKRIISNYCIGCDGEVRTVGLFSNVALHMGTRLIVDHHSRTSTLLAMLLLKDVFHIDIPVHVADIDQFEANKNDIVLMIGDKVFQREHEFAYKVDLGDLWKQHTGLPFVFALWVSNKELPEDVISMLNASLTYGMRHIDKIIELESSENLDLYYYFKQNISYVLDDDKKKALEVYLNRTKILYHTLIAGASKNA